MNESNFVLELKDKKKKIEIINNNRNKLKNILDCSFQLYLINEIYRDGLINDNEYFKIKSLFHNNAENYSKL